MNSHLLLYIEALQLSRLRRSSLLGLLTLLVSCVSAPPASENGNWLLLKNQLLELNSWELRGRVNIRYDNESHTPRIQWQQQNVEYSIRLWGTFNAGNTLINGRPGFVTLEQDGEEVNAQSPEELILDQLGYELPVSYLEYWIKGIPSPESEAQLEFNVLEQLSSIRQAGWTITYSDSRQYGPLSLPARIELTRPQNDIRMRFIGLNWTLNSDVDD